MTGAIWWLASYPKSGNTWLRAVLATLVAGEAVDINAMAFLGGIASGRSPFDEVFGVNSADLSAAQIANLRPRAYDIWSREAEHPLFCKVHDAFGDTPAGAPLFPASATAGAVYLVRDPRAVAVSFAHHLSVPLDGAIARMDEPATTLAESDRRLSIQLTQSLRTWSEHVESWLAAPFPVHVARYEDMLAAPLATFSAIVRFMNLPCDEEMIAEAVEAADFPRLQAQEREKGFMEKPGKAKVFFREGRAEGWRAALSDEQAARIVAAHGPVMRRLGYQA